MTQIQRLAQDTSDLSKDNTKTTTNFTIWTYRSILYNRLVMLGPVCEERRARKHVNAVLGADTARLGG